MKRIKYIVPIIFSFTLIGCSAIGLNDDEAPEASQSIDGRWASACEDGRVRVLSFDVTQFSIDTIAYRSSACEEVSRAGRNVVTGNFTVGGDYTTDDGDEATKIDVEYRNGTDNIVSSDPQPIDIYRIERVGDECHLMFGRRKAINRNRPGSLLKTVVFKQTGEQADC